MWKVKTKTIPAIVGAIGLKLAWEYVKEIPGNLSLTEVQKTVLNITLIILEGPFLSKRNNYI